MFNTIKDFALESITALLAFFYSLPVVGGSYGIAIMLLTATVMIALMPLTLKATRSTIKMTQLQPQLKALQKEYKDDKQELNQAMMALYQENGVNPVGGCLPMLAQLPVFLVLFNVLRGLTRRVSEKSYFAIADHAREVTGGQAIATNTFDPEHLSRDTELYQDLSQATEMNFGPFDLAVDAWDVVQTDFVRSLAYILLIVFVVASSYYQQRQVSARRGSQPDNPTPQQQTQQQLLRVLPLMSGVWSFLFPAGLVLYWATSNLFRIGQQAYITRALYQDEAADDAKVAAGVVADGDTSDSTSSKGGASNGSKSGSASSNGGKNSGKKKSKDSDNGDGLIGDGRPGKSGSSKSRNGAKSDGKNGSNGDSSSRDADRNAAWERRRAQRTKAQQSRKKTASADGSSRTTPKGTKPSDQKKRRKR